MTDLADGRYDVVVIEAEPAEQAEACRLELLVTAGPRKGQVIGLDLELGSAGPRDPTDLLGLPATVVVDGGVFRFDLD